MSTDCPGGYHNGTRCSGSVSRKEIRQVQYESTKLDDEHKNARDDGCYKRMNKKVLSKDLQVVGNIVAADEEYS